MRKKIIVKGPVMSRSGYGEQSRFALRALRSREDLFDIYIKNIPWGKTGMVAEATEEQTWIKEILLKSTLYAQRPDVVDSSAAFQGASFDVSLQITVPHEFEKMAPVNIGYTAGIETTKVSPQWISKANETVDKIITISKHSKAVLEDTKYDLKDQAGNEHKNWGLQVPVEVVNYPIRKSEPVPLDIEFTTDKNFLVVAQWSVRKNMENTIKWFIETFKDDETVGLVLKTNLLADSIIDREHTTARLQALIAPHKDRKCKIYLIHGELVPGQLEWLYQHPTMKALINIAHGEGYGLPMFEAAYNGLPLITTTWSGQMDFICKPNKKGKRVPRVIRVDYDIKPVQKQAVWKGVIEENSMWAYAKENSFKRALQSCLEKEAHHQKEAKTLQRYILQNFKEEDLYEQFVALVNLQSTTDDEIDDLFSQLQLD